MRRSLPFAVGLILLVSPPAGTAGDLDLRAIVAMAQETSPLLIDMSKRADEARGRLVNAKILLPSNPEQIGRASCRERV